MGSDYLNEKMCTDQSCLKSEIRCTLKDFQVNRTDETTTDMAFWERV